MRAAVMCQGAIVADELAEPFSGASADTVGNRIDPDRDLVTGHEFCAEILDHGPGTARSLAPGTRRF